MLTLTKNKVIIFLIVILLISFFLRLWQLDSIPPGVYPDEAMNANEAISNPGKVFYPENNGREGFFINLIALSFSIFGISIWSLKIVPAIIGILTVLGLYLLTKELFSLLIKQSNGQTIIALLSSFFLASSFWHINFSRIGFRAILLPFILVFGFYFLFKGFRLKKLSDFIIAGIFFGLGFHTYISYRLVVLLLFVLLINFLLIYRKEGLQKKYLFFVSFFMLFIFIIALPIGIYFLQNPQDFMSRAGPISIFSQESPIKSFLISFASHLGMFNFYGDSNWRHNFSGSPQLLFPIGILFLIGFLYSIKNIISSVRTKNYSLFAVYFLIIGWFFVMLLPGSLTYEGIPHALRVIGVIPAAYIFAGIGGFLLYLQIKKIIPNKKFLYTLCFAFLALIAISGFNKYFNKWAKNDNVVEGAFTKKFVEIGDFLNTLSAKDKKYVIVNEGGVRIPLPDGIPMPAQTVMFIEKTKLNSKQSIYLLPEDLSQIIIEGNTIIVPMKYDQELLNEIQKRFPEGKIQEKNGIFIYKITTTY